MYNRLVHTRFAGIACATMISSLLNLVLAFACTSSAKSNWQMEISFQRYLQEISVVVREATKLGANVVSSTAFKADPAYVPRHPKVPKRFAAPITVEFNSTVSNAHTGMFACDVHQQIIMMDLQRTDPFSANLSPPLSATDKVLHNANSTYMISGKREILCRSLPKQSLVIHDIFGWASTQNTSYYIGQRVIGSKQCSCWQPRLQHPNNSVVLCTDGDFPVELSLISKSSTSQNVSLRFDDPIAVGDHVNSSLFAKPQECSKVAPPCSSSVKPTTVEVDAYVFHPGMSASDFNISSQDVADDVGEAAFICTDRMKKSNSSFIDHNYTLITRYTLLMSAVWGQYAMCNGYADTTPPGPSCFGGDMRLVGRASPMEVGDGEMRCALKSPIGFWFSLPEAGRCARGEVPGSQAFRTGCTWTQKRMLKTISQTCLLQSQRFIDSCFADLREGKGYPRSTRVLRAAFASQNVQEGGCPDVGGRPHSTITGQLLNTRDAILV